MKKKDLTTGSVSKTIINLTLPMMIGMISMVAFNLIDTYYVGKLGKTELAALSFTFPIIMVVFSIIQGLGMGATALIAKSIGMGNREKAARETTDSLMLTFIITAGFVIAGSLSLQAVLKLLGASGVTQELATDYMSIWYYALLFVSVPFVGNSAIRATGDAKTPSLIMLFAVVVNAVLDPILIFGYWGLPAMGLKGAAIATAISRALTLVLALYVLIKREKLIVFTSPGKKVVIGCWKAILWIAIPSGLARLVVPIATGIITALLADYGEFAVAAFGVGSRIEFLASSVLFALAASIGPFVGQNLGKGDLERVKSGVSISNRFAVIWGLFAWGCLALFSHPIAALFNNNADVIKTVELFLWIIPAGFGMKGVLNVVNTYFNTVNKPLQASLMVIIQMLILAVPAMIIGKEMADIKGIFLGLTLAMILGGVYALLMNVRITRQITIVS